MTENNAEMTNELTVNIGAGDLLNLLGNTLLFASKDSTLPVLNAVQLHLDGDALTAYATDRYRLARARFQTRGVVSGDPLLLPKMLMTRSVVDQFVKVLKGDKKGLNNNALLTAVIGKPSKFDGYRVTAWRLEYGNANVRTDQDLPGDYPKIAQLFPNVAPNEPVGMFAFKPEFLADMGKVKDLANTGKGWNSEPLRIVGNGSPSKPTSFYRFDWFEGLLMPVRMPAGTEYGNYNLAA